MVEGSFLTRPFGEMDHGFRAKIAENPLDQLARDVYSDYLEENGDQEEADRQRQWTTAYRSLENWADRYGDEGGNYVSTIEYWFGELLDDGSICFSTTDYPMEEDEIERFCTGVEIVLGRRIPADKKPKADDYPFSCSC